MPRPLRIEYPNAWYHVMNRGANHQAIFKTTKHRQLFLSLLEEITEQYKVHIHAYCLMSNHYHLLVQTELANLGQALRHLNGIYTQRFNRLEKRDGALFRGRYKAILIDANSYALQVSRYIHLNPCEAKLCKSPENYLWSSFQAYQNMVEKPGWLTTNFILSQFSETQPKKRYKQFIGHGIDNEIKEFYNKLHLSPVLGAKEFLEKQLAQVKKEHKLSSSADIKRIFKKKELKLIQKVVANFYDIKEPQLFEVDHTQRNEARMVGMFLARRVGLYTYREIAESFTNIKAAGVGAAIQRCERLMQLESKFRQDVEKIKKLLDK